jgi:hypothetical protein
MPYKIRDWDLHFEADRSKQWKSIKWVPIPNKQGSGYRRIMSEKNGLEIFACWIALIQVASTCNPRGDLSKYNLDDLSRLTLCDIKKLELSINYCSQRLDWIEVIGNIDKNVNECQKNVIDNASGSSILFNSIQCSSVLSEEEMQEEKQNKIIPPKIEWIAEYCKERKNGIDPQYFFDHYETRGWKPKGSNTKMKDWQSSIRTWEKNNVSTGRENGTYNSGLRSRTIKNNAGKPGYDASGKALGAAARPGEFDEGILTLDGVPDHR